MSNLIKFYSNDLVDALYYFEYHGPLYKNIKWIPRESGVKDLYKLVKEIKFTRFKYFLPWARYTAVINQIDSPKKLAKYIKEHPPRGKFGEQWAEDHEKMNDILQEIFNLFKKNVLSDQKKNELEELRERIRNKYSKIMDKLKVESEKIPGIIWKRKEPIICLVYPIDGRLSHTLNFADIAFIETSELMLNDENSFFHDVVKVLNFKKPVGAWVKQDRRGIRAIAYELFTQMQTQKIVEAIYQKKPNFRKVILEKLDTIWIPVIRDQTLFDEDELERILLDAYKMIPKHKFDALYQLGELYTELNIILLT
ncbi:MAG: hypothetical protein ACFFDW_14750 [Candidatus Thorarchaeota archaeon]